MSLESNVFTIKNLKELSSKYKLYSIRGLNNAPDEYYVNCQTIIRTLSYSLRSPVTIIQRDNQPMLVVDEKGGEPPINLSVIRTVVRFDRLPGFLDLDYTLRTPENDIICLRFLDFAVQGVLFKNPSLWQPSAGNPFFKKQPENETEEPARYNGFSVRATITPDGQLGLCVDATSKLVGSKPLNAHMSQDEFAIWKNRTFVYHYGHQWYEVQLMNLSDMNATEYIIPGTQTNLLDWAVQECRKPIPTELASVPHDAGVALYLNNRKETRGVLLPLCYPVQRTITETTSSLHQPPHVRRRSIGQFVRNSLQNIRFGGNVLKIAAEASEVASRIFTVPDLLFGNGQVLSVRSTPGAQHTSLDQLGQARMGLLKRKSAGFYTQRTLDRQYLILPQSVADSFGERFTEDLKSAVADLYPMAYKPELVTYNDRVAKTFPKQGNAILNAVRSKCTMPGYAVVMIHHLSDRTVGEEDQLAAMVMRELRKPEIDIKATVIHSATGQECYQLVQDGATPVYKPKETVTGKLRGYLRMVAINKILLNKECWPFVLSTKLHADLTIGLDVKHNTAGFVVVSSNGGEITTFFKTSRQKEKLEKDQLKAYLVEIVRQEVKSRKTPFKTIVLQRDGRSFDTELTGTQEAVDLLKKEGAIASDGDITVVDIPKSSPVHFRIFDVGERNWIENPQIGTYYLANDSEGYLCATGRAFRKSGTVRPLHVRKVQGSLSLEKCIEDIFYLTCLPWTRPDDATRYPITIKLNDRFLGEEATDYNADVLDIDATLDDEYEPDEIYV